jgi:hypothetical protein
VTGLRLPDGKLLHSPLAVLGLLLLLVQGASGRTLLGLLLGPRRWPTGTAGAPRACIEERLRASS